MGYHYHSKDSCITNLSHQLNSWDITKYHWFSLIIIDFQCLSMIIWKFWKCMTDWVTDQLPSILPTSKLQNQRQFWGRQFWVGTSSGLPTLCFSFLGGGGLAIKFLRHFCSQQLLPKSFWKLVHKLQWNVVISKSYENSLNMFFSMDLLSEQMISRSVSI